MWLLFKETAKGILYILFCISGVIVAFMLLYVNKQDWLTILVLLFMIPLFSLMTIEYTYYTILLRSKLKEGYSSLNQIISELYIFKNEYFIEKFSVFEKRIYLNKIEKIVLDYYENDADDIFFTLSIEYQGKKISILLGYVENFLKYFSENLIGFDSSILKDDCVDFLKLQKRPTTLYEKNKML